MSTTPSRLVFAAALAAWLPVSATAAPAGPARMPPIRLVLIDAKTTRTYGPLPWTRDRHAEIVRLLDRAGARTIALRFYFRDSRGDRGDAALVDAVTKCGRVVAEVGKAAGPEGWVPDDAWLGRMALGVTGKPPQSAFGADHLEIPYEALARAVRGVGSVDIILNKERKLEGLPLVMAYKNRILPSLGLRLFLQAAELEAAPMEFLQEPETIFGMIRVQRTKALRIGTLRVAIDPWGSALVNLTAAGRGYPTSSFVDVLKGDVKPSEFKDAIVLVGADTVEMNVETSTGPKNGIELAADQVRALYQYLEDSAR